MISSLKRLIVGTAAILGFAASANAAYVPNSWSDYIGGSTSVGAGDWHVYQHDIKDTGFRPLYDLVTDFTLTIDLYDDPKDTGWLRGERVQVLLSGFPTENLLFGGDVEDKVYVSDVFDLSLSNGWTFTGLLELNALGTLTVGITSYFGDFIVGDSNLIANGVSPAQVPEPGTLALLGLGLLGVGFGRRKLAK